MFDEQEDLFSRDSLGNLYHCRGEGITTSTASPSTVPSQSLPFTMCRSVSPEIPSVKPTSQVDIRLIHAESSTKDETHNGPGLYGNAWTIVDRLAI